MIEACGSYRLEVRDLCALDESAQQAAVREATQHEVAYRFNLSREPLFRATLLKVSERGHVLLLTLHHIISDGWSLAVISHELSALYEAYSQGRESPLPGLPVQYADYAIWQRAWLRNR